MLLFTRNKRENYYCNHLLLYARAMWWYTYLLGRYMVFIGVCARQDSKCCCRIERLRSWWFSNWMNYIHLNKQLGFVYIPFGRIHTSYGEQQHTHAFHNNNLIIVKIVCIQIIFTLINFTFTEHEHTYFAHRTANVNNDAVHIAIETAPADTNQT